MEILKSLTGQSSLSIACNQPITQKLVLVALLGVALNLTGCQNASPLNVRVANPAKTTNSSLLMQTQSNYANSRYLNIDGNDYPIAETSARLLVDANSKTPNLVADIFDGKGNTAVPGYKIMLINRTSSLAAEGRVRDGKIIDNRMIHRGSKSLVGIPVVNGQPRVDQAQLLDFDIIYDDPSKALVEGEVVKPRGTKMTKSDVPVTNKQITIGSLTLPNVVSGERAGGGVIFEASALVNGKLVKTGANSAFTIFDTTTPDKAKGF